MTDGAEGAPGPIRVIHAIRAFARSVSSVVFTESDAVR